MRKWLVELRGNRSQQDVAKASGISQSFYASIEIGTRRPSVEVAKRIANVLGFEWQQFYEDKCA
ncbi:helix-turn-helix transcriptional regulator [Feifania hominis]|uniref:Helix-turn-helix transcriptional regulator n=1 Tax=Feifania hominis TaxID=2763660 RepID=A0A926DHR9_9FIRM|nr:helix-turn-helix transcriptional regulator [Feifania hominis]MBC8537300.1 helix-turn-helix transcriptional regulator [Feifania hominis]